VEPGDQVAADHTFAPLKNFLLPGGKYIFDMLKGLTRELLMAGIVASTAIAQVIHMLVECCKKRPNFKPSVIWTDTCPSNDSTWKGDNVLHYALQGHVRSKM
jgi:hypothetical protein